MRWQMVQTFTAYRHQKVANALNAGRDRVVFHAFMQNTTRSRPVHLKLFTTVIRAFKGNLDLSIGSTRNEITR